MKKVCMMSLIARKNRKFLIGGMVVTIILVCNIPLVSFLIGFVLDKRHFYGQNDYVYVGQNGFDSRDRYYDDYDDVLAGFSQHKKKQPEDSILYRTFKINPLKFWYWREYIVEPQYRLPYKQLENQQH